MSEAAEAPTTPMVEVDGYTFPKRIPGQAWIEENLPLMEDEEAQAFYNLLIERRWVDHEFETRIYPIRPELRPTPEEE